MRRTFEFIAWIGALSTTIWCANSTFAADKPAPNPPKGGGATDSPQSARGLYKEGRRLFQDNRFAQAVDQLEQAQSAGDRLSETERRDVQTLLAKARKQAASETSVVRGQSAGDRKPVNAKELLAEARREFNCGHDEAAEKMARACHAQGLRPQLFGDSPDKLLEDIAEFRQVESSWKKDSRSPAAKKQRVAYLLKRARQVNEEADTVNAERYVRLADQAGLEGEGPLQYQMGVARKMLASRVTVARGASARSSSANEMDEEATLRALEASDTETPSESGDESSEFYDTPASIQKARVVDEVEGETAPVESQDEDAADEDWNDEPVAPVAQPKSEARSPKRERDTRAAREALEARAPRERVEEDVPELSEEPAAFEDRPAVETANVADEELASAPAFEDPGVVAGHESGADLFRQGKEALRAGDRDAAYDLYLRAYKSGQKLSARQMSEIREFLSTHSANQAAAKRKKKIQLTSGERAAADEATAEDSEPIEHADDRRQAAADKLRTEVRNAKYKAEKLADTDPDPAQAILSKAQEAIEASGLDARVTAPLLKSLVASRQQVDYSRKINGPKIELDQRNAEVRGSIKRERDFKAAIEKEFAEKVDEFNQLIREKR
ncbi:MAG: hypothetical protein NT069_11880, partial [Planctomycetota bacterium]|nr:hypothetical protein [Planctomycetota bacterium]